MARLRAVALLTMSETGISALDVTISDRQAVLAARTSMIRQVDRRSAVVRRQRRVFGRLNALDDDGETSRRALDPRNVGPRERGVDIAEHLRRDRRRGTGTRTSALVKDEEKNGRANGDSERVDRLPS